MGRPLNKRYFGPTNPPQYGFSILAWLPASTSQDYVSGPGNKTGAQVCYIVRQTGSHRYMVSNAPASPSPDGGPTVGEVYLTNNSAPTVGQAYLLGYTTAPSTNPVALQKLTAHKAYDFSGNIYSWSIANNGTTEYIELVYCY